MSEPELITLGQACRIIPGRPSTLVVWRWARRGLKARNGQRVHLYHVRIGRKIFTTAPAVQAFFEEVAREDAIHFRDTEAHEKEKTGTGDSRSRALDAANKELTRIGVLTKS